jgi:hypothetical protein
MNKYRYLLLFFSIVWVSNIEAQTISLKGVVKDSSEQKSPLSKTLVNVLFQIVKERAPKA